MTSKRIAFFFSAFPKVTVTLAFGLAACFFATVLPGCSPSNTKTETTRTTRTRTQPKQIEKPSVAVIHSSQAETRVAKKQVTDEKHPRVPNVCTRNASHREARIPTVPTSEIKSAHPIALVAATTPASGVVKKAKKKHAPLFVGWPKPAATLLITGRQEGYIEPCGCSGLDVQKGGLSRRFTFFRQMTDKGWNPVGLDVGNQVHRHVRQAEIKFQTVVDGLRKMKYQAVGLGPDDLKLAVGELLAAVAPQGNNPSLFVSANVNVFNQAAPYRVISAGGKKIGVTAILGAAEQKKVQSSEIEMTPAKKALTKVWKELAAKKCDVYVLLAYTSIEESRELAKAFPGFAIVVTAGGVGEPTFQPEKLNEGKTMLVQIGTKGMYVGAIGLFNDAKTPMRYQRVPMDDRFPDSREMQAMMAEYQKTLQREGWKGLAVRPVPHPSGRTFVGSDQCSSCHAKAYKIWAQTKHAHALQTLVKPPERIEVARHFDPECIACHVIGWNPRTYRPYKSGYLSQKLTPKKANVGCESCHGPGSAHVAAEDEASKASDAEKERYQKEMILSYEKAEAHCQQCHDLDNSAKFHEPDAFKRYWKKVEHNE